MKAAKLRDMTSDELAQQLREVSGQMFDIRVRRGTGDQSTPPQRIRGLRRDIARIKTVTSERKAEHHG